MTPDKSSLAEYGRTLWLTNLPAPYRIPVWRAMATECDLRIGVLASHDKDGRWDMSPALGLHIHVWRSIHIRLAGYEMFVPLSMRCRDLLWADRMLLGHWEFPICMVALFVARLRKIPVFYFYESTAATHGIRRGPVAFARRLLLSLATGVITPGAAATEAVRGLGIDHSRIHETYNAVDVRGINEKTRAIRLAQGFRDTDEHRFLYVGQLIDRKNVDSVLLAFSAIRLPSDRLVIAGSGELDQELRSTAAALGLNDAVRFMGEVPYPQLPELLADCDTLVLASIDEVWGLVVNEALAAGLHVIVSRNAGVWSSVSSMDGVYGANPDPSSIAKMMARSRSEYTGPIYSPEILEFDASAMASDVLCAIGIAPVRRPLS